MSMKQIFFFLYKPLFPKHYKSGFVGLKWTEDQTTTLMWLNKSVAIINVTLSLLNIIYIYKRIRIRFT